MPAIDPLWIALGIMVVFLSGLGAAFWAGVRVGAAPVPSLTDRLEAVNGRLRAVRESLATQLRKERLRRDGARADFDAERRLQQALATPHERELIERLLHEFDSVGAQEGAAATEPGDEADA